MKKVKTDATPVATKEDTQSTVANNTSSPFAQAANMDLNQAVTVLAQAAQLAQKSGVLTVNDAVLVARALELLRGQEQTNEAS
tara:strand:+ start:405 stop:653 length:249 start_codon:yes stop_codon:yes gene_type:complete